MFCSVITTHRRTIGWYNNQTIADAPRYTLGNNHPNRDTFAHSNHAIHPHLDASADRC